MENKLSERKNIRLKNYDYSTAGAYFLTICTEGRQNYFWNDNIDLHKFRWYAVGANCVRPHNLPLSDIGKIVADELNTWNDRYDSVFLQSYVIMPDHIHIMVIITSSGSGRTQFAPTEEAQGSGRTQQLFCNCNAPTVSRMVKQFKGAITKRVGHSIWQKSFIDHIIRDREDFDVRVKYILDNPARRYYGDD